MKTFEAINLLNPILNKVVSVGISIEDIKYIDMYNDYLRMKKEGHKQIYLAACLSEQYNISERTFYRIIKKFENEI